MYCHAFRCAKQHLVTGVKHEIVTAFITQSGAGMHLPWRDDADLPTANYTVGIAFGAVVIGAAQDNANRPGIMPMHVKPMV